MTKPTATAKVIPIHSPEQERAEMLHYTARGQRSDEDQAMVCVEQCSRCGDAVPITRWAWDRMVEVNRMLQSQGMPPLESGERAMCAPCLPLHKADQDAELVRQDDRDRLLWRRYVAEQLDEAERRRRPYKVISVSMYLEDLDRADMMVGELRRRGDTSATRSSLIRDALAAYERNVGPGGAPDNGVDGEGSR